MESKKEEKGVRSHDYEGYGLFGLIASICIFLGWASILLDAVISIVVFFLPDSLAALFSFIEVGPKWTELLKKIGDRWGTGLPSLLALGWFVMGLWGAAQWFVLGYGIRLALDFRIIMRQQRDLLNGLTAAEPRRPREPVLGL